MTEIPTTHAKRCDEDRQLTEETEDRDETQTEENTETAHSD